MLNHYYIWTSKRPRIIREREVLVAYGLSRVESRRHEDPPKYNTTEATRFTVNKLAWQLSGHDHGPISMPLKVIGSRP